jgi:PPOX class probable FMN-dependent enzyme
MSDVITSAAELEELLGEVSDVVRNKVRPHLHPLDRDWLAGSPLCFVATSNAAGDLDVSPKGDPAGFAMVLDDATIAIPERPGNRRADGFHNLLENPHIGLIFVIPGRGDTLRINGTATLVRDAPWFDEMIVKGNRPILATVVKIDEVFYHCSKAFLRSKAWDADAWHPDAAPRRALIAHSIDRKGTPLEELEEYYGPSYGDKIYG